MITHGISLFVRRADETAASKMLDKSLKDIRANISEKTVDIYSGYRKIFSGSHPPGLLVLPEQLKEFSMYMLGLVKSRAFKGGSTEQSTKFSQHMLTLWNYRWTRIFGSSRT